MPESTLLELWSGLNTGNKIALAGIGVTLFVGTLAAVLYALAEWDKISPNLGKALRVPWRAVRWLVWQPVRACSWLVTKLPKFGQHGPKQAPKTSYQTTVSNSNAGSPRLVPEPLSGAPGEKLAVIEAEMLDRDKAELRRVVEESVKQELVDALDTIIGVAFDSSGDPLLQEAIAEIGKYREYLGSLPIRAVFEDKVKAESERVSVDLQVFYTGDGRGDVKLPVAKTELELRTTRRGLTMGGTDMPSTTVRGSPVGWVPRPIHMGRTCEAANISFEIKGPARHIYDFPSRELIARADVTYRGTEGSGVYRVRQKLPL